MNGTKTMQLNTKEKTKQQEVNTGNEVELNEDVLLENAGTLFYLVSWISHVTNQLFTHTLHHIHSLEVVVREIMKTKKMLWAPMVTCYIWCIDRSCAYQILYLSIFHNTMEWRKMQWVRRMVSSSKFQKSDSHPHGSSSILLGWSQMFRWLPGISWMNTEEEPLATYNGSPTFSLENIWSSVTLWL